MDGRLVASKTPGWKQRFSAHGTHLFHRESGLNVLVEDHSVSTKQWATAPRYVSIALTNTCNLQCSYCYAPKHRAALSAESILEWAEQLDAAGCLGIGFGGGEPTLHPRFAEICRSVAQRTGLAVTFTTHGHQVTEQLAQDLQGTVHFVRVSVDGVGDTYSRLRGRPFDAVVQAIKLLASITQFGINVVVNQQTIGDLDELAALAEDLGAKELLLLPEQPTVNRPGISPQHESELKSWIRSTATPIQIALSDTPFAESLPLADPFPGSHPLEAHAHITSDGRLSRDAYSPLSVPVGTSVMSALDELKRTTT